MDIEKVKTEGIIFKKPSTPSSKPKSKKVKTKAKTTSYKKGTHGSASAKMKTEIKQRRVNRPKKAAKE